MQSGVAFCANAVSFSLMIICGIDPGFTGALAFISKNKIESIKDMPLVKVGRKKQVCAKSVAALLLQFSPQIAVIENVHSMPAQGVASTFTFGYNAGILLGVCEALGIHTVMVAPQVWKGALALSVNKRDSILLAKKKWPRYEHYFMRQKDNGRAEAALIASLALSHSTKGKSGKNLVR